MEEKRLTRRGLLLGGGSLVLAGVLPSWGMGSERVGPTGKPGGLDFATVVRRRVMIRAYTSEPIPGEKIQRLLRYAVRAPSAGNLQPWEFIVIKDPSVKEQLTRAAFGQTQVSMAPVIIATCANVARSSNRYGERGVFYSLVDTAFASLLILLGAVDEGLGACFVGAYRPEEVSKILALPDHVRPVGLITLGYPAEKPRRRPGSRIPLKNLVHYDRW